MDGWMDKWVRRRECLSGELSDFGPPVPPSLPPSIHLALCLSFCLCGHERQI